MMHKLKTVAVLGSVSISMLFFATGCSKWQTETALHQERPTYQTGKYSDAVKTADVDENFLRQFAKNYNRSAVGELYVSVLYDPASAENDAMSATKDLARILGSLKTMGLDSPRGDIIPIKNLGDISKTLFTYKNITALAPDNCRMMPGIDERATRADDDYKLGCSVESYFVRQIARPSDLAGNNGGLPPADAEKNANIADIYRSGEPADELDGETLSED